MRLFVAGGETRCGGVCGFEAGYLGLELCDALLKLLLLEEGSVGEA